MGRHVHHQNPKSARSGPNIGTTLPVVLVPVSSAVTSWRIDYHIMTIKFSLPYFIVLYFTSDASGIQKNAQIVTNAQTEAENVMEGISLRQPSIALGFIMTSQLQFLGALSLVNYNTTQDPLLKDFVGRFR